MWIEWIAEPVGEAVSPCNRHDHLVRISIPQQCYILSVLYFLCSALFFKDKRPRTESGMGVPVLFIPSTKNSSWHVKGSN